MSEIDDVIRIGDPLPTISHVEKASGPFRLLVRWAEGRRQGEEVIDVAPQILTFKVYMPLRDDPDLFARVAVSEDGTAIVWPGSADLEISSDAIEQLAEDARTGERLATLPNV